MRDLVFNLHYSGKPNRMTQSRPRKHKILKWMGGIGATLIVILASAAFYIGAKWKPFLTSKIKAAVYESSQHLYKLDFNDLHVNVISGSVTIDSLKLRPDTAVYNQLRKTKHAPLHIYDIKMANLRLTRIGFFTAYKERRINMNSIILDHPSINMIHHKVPAFQDTSKVEKTLYQQISKTLKSVHVRSIKVLDADFDYLEGETGRKLNSVKHLNIDVSDILVDSLSQYDTTRFYYSKNVDFQITGYKSLTKNNMYTLKVDSVSGSASRGQVSIKGFKMIPMYPELTFSRKAGTQKDRYDLNVKSIQIRGLDFARINSEGLVHARGLSISRAKLKIFRNKGIRPKIDRRPVKFPHMELQELQQPLILDTILLKNIDVAYGEYNPIPEKRGSINFDIVSGRLLNVTNDSLQLNKHQHLTASVKARVNHAADLDLRFNFDLRAKDAAFSYQGNVSAFDMRALNPAAVALGMVAIQSGQVQKIDFDVRANELGANGSLRMYYKDLKVTLLKEGEDGGQMKKKGLLSFVANTFVVKDSNPSSGEPLRVAKINFKRLPTSSFFSLLWDGVFSGMRESIGITGVKATPPMKSFRKVLNKIAERKARRQERREKRQEKRKEKQQEHAKLNQ
jgi:hypothetical protein